VSLGALLSFAIPPGDEGASNRPDNGVWWRLAVPFAESLIGAVVLWRARGMSLRSLRGWELVCFATDAAFHGYDRFERLAYPDVAVQLAPTTAIGFAGLSTLQGFVTLILAYGVLVPNTRWRSLRVVAVLTAVPLVAIPAAVAVNPILREGHFAPLIVQ
jgi:hypothetical protein